MPKKKKKYNARFPPVCVFATYYSCVDLKPLVIVVVQKTPTTT